MKTVEQLAEWAGRDPGLALLLGVVGVVALLLGIVAGFSRAPFE